jgi:D-beta-D-heptose 7-phosphate kinase/D-beta-D-heptose 1-phosphate adenosyltransferase
MKVLVIGDIIIDKYITGTSTRLSPEAPVPVVSQQDSWEQWGGAYLVYLNLMNLQVDVEMLDLSSPKCVKTRVLCDGHYVTRIDQDYKTDGTTALNEIYKKDFSAYDVVILSDYNKGVLEYSQQIIEHINKYDCKIIVDPKRHFSCYDGAWLVKPNRKEFEELGFTNWTGNIIITAASDPTIAQIDSEYYTIETDPVEVNDVTGAGDCFLATFVYGMSQGKNYEDCLKLAVKGATESVKHTGTYVVKPEDLQYRTIFTNGVFDILHRGHLTLLKQAHELGEKLVVGINSDASTKRLKGDSRPINTEQTRKEQLEILSWVDEVVVFDEDTPYELIKKLNPDMIVKGGDYTVEQVVGHDIVPVKIIPTVEGFSTTSIIEKNK